MRSHLHSLVPTQATLGIIWLALMMGSPDSTGSCSGKTRTAPRLKIEAQLPDAPGRPVAAENKYHWGVAQETVVGEWRYLSYHKLVTSERRQTRSGAILSESRFFIECFWEECGQDRIRRGIVTVKYTDEEGNMWGGATEAFTWVPGEHYGDLRIRSVSPCEGFDIFNCSGDFYPPKPSIIRRSN